jgi:tetratricopeptide (TPR) repeat protein
MLLAGYSFPHSILAEDVVAAYVPAVDPVTEYLDAIDSAEALSNAYSLELADLYLGLGQTLLDRREFEDAKEAFQQGMQIVRVNFGLNSPEQTNYLFAIADIETFTDQRSSADDVLQNIYGIHARNFGESDPGMLPVLEQLMDWYKVRRPMDSPGSQYADLETPVILATRMAVITEKDKGLAHPETAAIYREIGQIYWRTAEFVLGRGISIEKNLIIATGSPSQNPYTRSISVKTLINGGKEALTKVAMSVNLDENRSPFEKAEATAQLGDWNLAFGKKQTAAESYREAYAVLAESPELATEAGTYFLEPTPVRFMNTDLHMMNEAPSAKAGPELDISMTVTEGGRPLNVNVLNPPETVSGEDVRRLKRMISEMRFRPRLVDGEPVKAEGFVWQIPYIDADISP